MKRSNCFLSLSSLVLSLAFAAGCIAAAGGEDQAQNAEEAQALSADPGGTSAPTFEVIPLDDGGFRFISVGVVGRPAGAVWAKLKNMAHLVPIVLPGIASGFEWVDGGSPGKVPSRFQFSVNGSTLLEEVFYRSHEDHMLQYQLVTPALGIESYIGTIELDELDNGHTVVTFSRDMRFTDPAAADAISALVEEEMVNLLAYFAKGPN